MKQLEFTQLFKETFTPNDEDDVSCDDDDYDEIALKMIKEKKDKKREDKKLTIAP